MPVQLEGVAPTVAQYSVGPHCEFAVHPPFVIAFAGAGHATRSPDVTHWPVPKQHS